MEIGPLTRRQVRGLPTICAVADYQPGDAADFERLLQASYSRIVGTLTVMLGGDRAAAEDCAQDAFEKAYRNWARWSPTAPAEAWVHRIAINTAISALRKRKTRERHAEAERGRLRQPAGDGAGDLRLDLMEALARIPPRQAAALILRHAHGYTNRAIGKALGIPDRTVASRILIARRKMRGLLPDYDAAALAHVAAPADDPAPPASSRWPATAGRGGGRSSTAPHAASSE